MTASDRLNFRAPLPRQVGPLLLLPIGRLLALSWFWQWALSAARSPRAAENASRRDPSGASGGSDNIPGWPRTRLRG